MIKLFKLNKKLVKLNKKLFKLNKKIILKFQIFSWTLSWLKIGINTF